MGGKAGRGLGAQSAKFSEDITSIESLPKSKINQSKLCKFFCSFHTKTYSYLRTRPHSPAGQWLGGRVLGDRAKISQGNGDLLTSQASHMTKRSEVASKRV